MDRLQNLVLRTRRKKGSEVTGHKKTEEQIDQEWIDRLPIHHKIVFTYYMRKSLLRYLKMIKKKKVVYLYV